MSVAFPSWASRCRPSSGRQARGGPKDLEAKIAELKSKKDAKTAELLPDVESLFQSGPRCARLSRILRPTELDFADQCTGRRPGAGRAARQRPGAMDDAPPASSSAATSRRSTARCSRMAWSCPRAIPAKAPAASGCDIWFHGRGETLSEVNFLDDRARNAGPVHARRHDRPAPLRPLLQRQQVRRRGRRARGARLGASGAIAIDDDRIAVRGFSMGGAAALAVRRPLRRPLVRRQPGAGLHRDARVPQGLPEGERRSRPGTRRGSGTGTTAPTGAVNLRQCPTVAYSGEIDSQKQAADVMAEALGRRRDRAGPHHRPEDGARHTTRSRRSRSSGELDSRWPRRPRLAAAGSSSSRPTRSATTG